ncbi:hypothetical protein POP12_004 [Pectobacterium phage POP12]|nr:hypothetical protein POP12_004 [Pectobacterium phage POP12]
MFNEKEVKERLQKATEGLKKFIEHAKDSPFEIKCKNCGRSVYVGRCCDNPEIEVLE